MGASRIARTERTTVVIIGGGWCAGMGVMPAHHMSDCLCPSAQPLFLRFLVEKKIIHLAEWGACPELDTFENSSGREVQYPTNNLKNCSIWYISGN